MTSVHIFIISWAGQHGSAAAISKSIQNTFDNVTVVYSDPDANFAFDAGIHAIRRPNDLLFGDKFQACLDHFNSDVFLLIHADCACQAWVTLVEKCVDAFDRYDCVSAWAPSIDNTPFHLTSTEIYEIPNSSLSAVAQTDGVVLGLRRTAVDRLKQCSLESNAHGWGIDWMAICSAYVSNCIAVVDRSVALHHKPSRGYVSETAETELHRFLDQFTTAERVMYEALWGLIRGNRLRNKKDRRKRRLKFWSYWLQPA